MSSTNRVLTSLDAFEGSLFILDDDDISAWGYFDPAGDPSVRGQKWQILGNGLNNTIAGGNVARNDILEGEGGDDILLIQRGDDKLYGSDPYDLDDPDGLDD